MSSRDKGIPCIIVSRKGRAFLETAVASLRAYATGITDVIVVDGTGDPDYVRWLDDSGYQFSLIDHRGEGSALEDALHLIAKWWRVEATHSVLLWPEEFELTQPLDVRTLPSTDLPENQPRILEFPETTEWKAEQ